MCGIIGYIGPRPVVPLIIEGLRRLEYRGYDSAGVAVVSDGTLTIRRSAGKLGNLEAAIAAEPLSGEFGLGHTRWATHGRPTEENAHPHRDCHGRIVVVHNGIIENFLELKRELQSQGHTFATETDTEVVAHLVEREWRDDGLEGAVRRAVARLKGLYAVVMLSADDPFKIVAVRNGPPVVVGLGEGEYFVASDIPAILAHTRNVVFLGDQEMAVVTRSGRRVLGLRRRCHRQDPDPGHLGSHRRREGRLQALHAQGDLRAAGGGARHHPGPRLAGVGHDLSRRDRARRRAPFAASTGSRWWPAARRGTRRWSASS